MNQNIINYMPRLKIFEFYICSNHYRPNQIYLPSKEYIQALFATVVILVEKELAGLELVADIALSGNAVWETPQYEDALMVIPVLLETLALIELLPTEAPSK